MKRKNRTLSFVYFAMLLLVKCNYCLCYDPVILFSLVVLVLKSSHDSMFLNFCECRMLFCVIIICVDACVVPHMIMPMPFDIRAP